MARSDEQIVIAIPQSGEAISFINMRDDIKQIIAQSLGVEVTDVDDNKLLREDLGLDETELDQILQVLQDRYELELVPEDKESIETVGDLLDTAESLSPKPTL